MSWRTRTGCRDCQKGLEYIQRIVELRHKRTIPMEVVSLIGDFAAKETWAEGVVPEGSIVGRRTRWRVYVKIRRTNFASSARKMWCESLLTHHGSTRVWWLAEVQNSVEYLLTAAIEEAQGEDSYMGRDDLLVSVYFAGDTLENERSKIREAGIRSLVFLGEDRWIRNVSSDGRFAIKFPEATEGYEVRRVSEEASVSYGLFDAFVDIRRCVWDRFQVVCVGSIDVYGPEEECEGDQEEEDSADSEDERMTRRFVMRSLSNHMEEYRCLGISAEEEAEWKKLEVWKFEIMCNRRKRQAYATWVERTGEIEV